MGRFELIFVWLIFLTSTKVEILWGDLRREMPTHEQYLQK